MIRLGSGRIVMKNVHKKEKKFTRSLTPNKEVSYAGF